MTNFKKNKTRRAYDKKLKEKKTPVTKKTGHHDLFFKQGFSKPRFAKELFQLALTKEEFSAFNWNNLKPEKDTFQNIRADLVFSVTLKNNPIRRVKIHLLLEHKSHFSQKTYYQILKYKTAVIGKSLEETGKAMPVFSVLLYHGPQPWPGWTSLKKGLWGWILSKIPPSLEKDMLDCGIRLVDTHSPAVEKAIKDKGVLSRGFLNTLKKGWNLKAEESSLNEAVSFFDNWPGDREELILSLGDYLWATVRGMTKDLWEKVERTAVNKGIFSKGGYMNIKEYIKEEARQEGIQQGMQKERQQVVLSMLKEKADMAFICKVTGLSEEEIKKLKNGSRK